MSSTLCSMLKCTATSAPSASLYSMTRFVMCMCVDNWTVVTVRMVTITDRTLYRFWPRLLCPDKNFDRSFGSFDWKMSCVRLLS